MRPNSLEWAMKGLAADARDRRRIKTAIVGALELECGVERVKTRH